MNLSLDPEGDTEPFYADDMVYYTTVANNGYSGDPEIIELWGLNVQTQVESKKNFERLTGK